MLLPFRDCGRRGYDRTDVNARRYAVWLMLGWVACRSPTEGVEPRTAGKRPDTHTEASEQRLWLSEQRRRVVTPELATAAREGQKQAIRAVARIGGPDALVVWLSLTEAPTVEPEVWYGVGLLEPELIPTSTRDELEDRLWTRYAVESNPQARDAQMFAIARIGDEPSQTRLAADLAELPATSSSRVESGFVAMGRLCVRGVAAPQEGLERIGEGLIGPNAWAAAFALSRCALPSAELLAGDPRRALASRLSGLVEGTEEDLEVSRWAWRALAAIGEVPKPVPPAILSSSPPTWLIEVEAVRALAQHSEGREVLVDRLASLDPPTEGARVSVVLEALRGLRAPIVDRPDWLTKLQPFVSRLDAATGDVSEVLRCHVAVLEAAVARDLGRLRECRVDAVPAIVADRLEIEALLVMPTLGDASAATHPISQLLERATSPNPAIASVTLLALADVQDDRVDRIVRDALQSEDHGVVTSAATTIAARSVASRHQSGDPTVAPLLELLESDPTPERLEAQLMAIEALTQLVDDARRPRFEAALQRVATIGLPPVRVAAQTALPDHAQAPLTLADLESQLPTAIREATSASVLRLHTRPGTIDIHLEPERAPMTTAALSSLATSGFYDGTRIHRIVPGFVIQGGDPQANGYGGPGFVLPSEWSAVPYERGTVGIAHAGKDSGGSQFFVTQSRQPHLDGRYTVIGTVSEQDMVVVDALLPFDAIERVEVR